MSDAVVRSSASANSSSTSQSSESNLIDLLIEPMFDYNKRRGNGPLQLPASARRQGAQGARRGVGPVPVGLAPMRRTRPRDLRTRRTDAVGIRSVQGTDRLAWALRMAGFGSVECSGKH